ncbi:MAG: DUF1194 domain-containing protein [Pseudomonadota bacterium]
MVRATLAVFATLWAGAAEAACRLALLLALDVSGSVDEAEYVLQLAGVAQALEDSEVRHALMALPAAPVSLAVFEWSSAGYQREVLGWTSLSEEADIFAVAAHLRGWRRAVAPEATGIGAALRHAADVFNAGPICWRKTLDVSGDGKNNDWPLPRDIYADGLLAGVTVNGLIVGQEWLRGGDERMLGVAELSAYYRANVIRGPGAFVEVAIGYDDFANAMTRKLLREVSAPELGGDAPLRRLAER